MFWYSLETPRRGASYEYPQHMFSGELEEIILELSSITPFFLTSPLSVIMKAED